MKLKPVAERFVLHWGEMGSKWGVNRTVSQIHALLYISGRPMHAEEIADTLGVARSTEHEHQDCRTEPDRGTRMATARPFQTTTNGSLRTVVRERKEREFDPDDNGAARPVGAPASSGARAQRRVRETLES